ncbi:MAG TPA: FmdB family zinc ribbon protein [Acidimicrobiales bacterium]|nr:FmdB family zinc ribbon protein [Acidimicrobiales bacterium]
MPTYEYECQACHQRVEAVQRFSDPALTTCEACGGQLKKVFSAVGIVFKGSGFYKNDSRGTSTSAAPAAASAPAAPASSD